jgi:hypothetical protein
MSTLIDPAQIDAPGLARDPEPTTLREVSDHVRNRRANPERTT